MSRCEDFPCCGHGNDPDGCPDLSRTNVCTQCGTKFHPDARCEELCPRCNAAHDIRHGYRDSDGEWVEGTDEDRDFEDDEQDDDSE